MKKLSIIITATILSISISAQDPHWNTDGNNSTNPNDDFVGTTDNADLRFRTFDTFKMTLTSPAGWLGLNITAPEMMFHVEDGGILSNGSIGNNPNIGGSTRLMWVPAQAAFRAGTVGGGQWDGGNVGTASAAFGLNNTASGDYSAVFGEGNTVTEDGEHSSAFGQNNTVSGAWSAAFADQNTVEGARAFCFGSGNLIEADRGVAVGFSNDILTGGDAGVSFGANNLIQGTFGMTLGRFLQATEDHSLLIGRGIDATNSLVNDIENSLMIGFNSTIPTVFVAEPETNETFGSVGIGITDLEAKLDVAPDPDEDPDKPHGIRVRWAETSDEINDTDALFAEIRRVPTSLRGRAVWGRAYNARNNFGGDFTAYPADGAFTPYNAGVRGMSIVGVDSEVPDLSVGGVFISEITSEPMNQRSVGVWGEGHGGRFAYGVFGYASGGTAQNYAGYFSGDVHATGTYTSSDESLKQNVEDLSGAMDLINQLEPKTYEFLTDQFDYLNLPQGEQMGIIAQDLEEVLPSLVKSAYQPAMYDTLGNEVSPELEFLSVNYSGLIPVLIGGIKEQQTTIDSLEQAVAEQASALEDVMELLDMMQDQIDNCCIGGQGFKSNSPDGVHDEQLQRASSNGNILEQNVPNPFRSQTTIRYTLEQGGKVLLNIFDKTGKPIATLVEAEQPADTYRYEWDASGLPAGMYHYALYVDGELLVKRAIKL